MRSKRWQQRTEVITGILVSLVIACVSVALQQSVFLRFVDEVGGRPDALFKTPHGNYYELWSLTVPFWATSVVMLGVALLWLARFRRRGYGWPAVVLWVLYIVVLWSVTVASSGLVEILGKGEVFI
jgi:uncharacterized membrane protein